MRRLSLLALAALAGAARAELQWKVTDIGSNGFNQANGIGNGGLAFGFGTQGRTNMVWEQGFGVTEIHTRPGTVGNTYLQDANGSGTVVGWQSTELGGGVTRREALVWDRALGTRKLFDFDDNAVEPYGISDTGIVVGRGGSMVDGMEAWKWTPTGGFKWLAKPDSEPGSRAQAVNSAGTAVGYSGAGGYGKPVIWRPDGSVERMAAPLNTIVWNVEDITDPGYVTGILEKNGLENGFLRDPSGNYTVIKNPLNPNWFTWGAGVNVHNQVVGRMYDGEGPYGLGGYFWSAETGSLYLDDHLAPGQSNWKIASAQGINDAGQIVGVGYDNGRLTAVLLEPVVPEPSTMAVFGLAGLAALRRSRRLRTPRVPRSDPGPGSVVKPRPVARPSLERHRS